MKQNEQNVVEIVDRADFVKFIDKLVLDFKENPEEWENRTLSDYLEAISAWTQDMDGYYLNQNLTVPQNVPWDVFARILIAAKMYE